MAWPRWVGATAAATALSAGMAVAGSPTLPAAQGVASPGPSEALSLPPTETPIADSIDSAVERFVRQRLAPCGGAEGVPCFPVTLEVEGRRYSVQESLRNLELDSRPAPGPPSAADMIQHGANPRSTSASVGLDPKTIACKTRQLIRKIRGKSRKYYLYRVWDERGERAVLRDRALDPEAPGPHLEYVSLGEFGDECEAVRAYVRSNHQIHARREADGPQPASRPGLELRSGDLPE